MQYFAEDGSVHPQRAGGIIGVGGAALGDRQYRCLALMRGAFRARVVGRGKPAGIGRRAGARVFVGVPASARQSIAAALGFDQAVLGFERGACGKARQVRHAQLHRSDLRERKIVLVQCGFNNSEPAHQPVEVGYVGRALEKPFEIGLRAENIAPGVTLDQRGAPEKEPLPVAAEPEIAVVGGT